jgi:hypothetical protein
VTARLKIGATQTRHLAVVLHSSRVVYALSCVMSRLISQPDH